MPAEFELEDVRSLEREFGSLKRSLRLAIKHGDPATAAASAKARADDLRVFFALNAFSRKRPFSELDPSLKEDVKVFFGSLAAADAAGRDLLRMCADTRALADACTRASRLGIGWLDGEHSLQLHSSLVPRLEPVLQAYVGCATVLYGDVSSADIVKIHIQSGKLSLLRFDDFLGKPIPLLLERAKVKLREQDLEIFEYGDRIPPPVLLFKSRYINEEYEGYPAQIRFDQEVERLGISPKENPANSWPELQRRLAAKRLCVVGHEVKPATDIPDIDSKCGKFLSYRQLIECGETWTRHRIPNVPKNPSTFNALYELTEAVLDPVIEYFGMIRLTYGFASPGLTRLIKRGIAPRLDQHSSCEIASGGAAVCSRLGAAVDFIVEDEDMAAVANWVIDNCAFDRLYYYGPDRPIHVSASTTPSREVYEVRSRDGRRLPPKRIYHVSGTTPPLSR